MKTEFGRIGKRILLSVAVVWIGQSILISDARGQSNESIERWIRELKHEDRLVRRDAARNLGRAASAASTAIPGLIEALDDEDDQVWYHSISALIRMGPRAESAVPDLIEDLSSPPIRPKLKKAPSYQVWYRSAYALSRIGAPAVPALRAALRHEHPRVRSGAAMALEWMGPAAAAAVHDLVPKLSDPVELVRYEAAKALGSIGSAAIDELTGVLASGDLEAKIGAAQALGKMRAQANRSRSSLITALEAETDAEFHAASIEALSRIGLDRRQSMEIIVKPLFAVDPLIQEAATSAALRSGIVEEIVVPEIIEALDSDESATRIRAAELAGHFGSKAAGCVKPLIRRVPSAAMTAERESLERAVVRIGAPAVAPLLQALSQQGPATSLRRFWIVRCLREIGSHISPELADALSSESAAVRMGSLIVLQSFGRIPLRSVHAAVKRCLDDPIALIRAEAIAAFVVIERNHDLVLAELRSALSDPAKEVRASAAASVVAQEVKAKPLLEPITHLLTDSDSHVRLKALEAIAVMGPEAVASVDVLIVRLREEDAPLIEPTILALGAMGAGAKSASPHLVRLLREDHPELRATLYASLASIGAAPEESLTELREGLVDEDPQVRRAALTLLFKTIKDKDERITVALKGLEDDVLEVRVAATNALGDLGRDGRKAAPSLFPLLDNSSDRQHAMDAIRRTQANDLDLFIPALQHMDSAVRRFAWDAVSDLGVEAIESLPALKKIASKESYDSIRQKCQEVIERLESLQ